MPKNSRIRSLFWEIYALLKKYKLTPHEIELKDEIRRKICNVCLLLRPAINY